MRKPVIIGIELGHQDEGNSNCMSDQEVEEDCLDNLIILFPENISQIDI